MRAPPAAWTGQISRIRFDDTSAAVSVRALSRFFEYALELRAELPPESFTSLLQGFPPNAFLVGFTSVNWRETWKYAERAFRYCQHDVGHAIGSARVAAQTLGWRMQLLDGVADDTLGALLGVDRIQDFNSGTARPTG